MLTTPRIRKTGRSVNNDLTKIFTDFGIFPSRRENKFAGCGGVDLATMANKMDLIPLDSQGKKVGTGLADLVSIFLRKTLPKPTETREGNWAVPTLDQRQIEYAALDAYVSLKLYEAIDRLGPVRRHVIAPHAEMPVEIRTGESASAPIIARGKILIPTDTQRKYDGINLRDPRRCLVQIEFITKPAALLRLHKKPLSTMGPVPFKAVVPIANLRVAVPLDVIARAAARQNVPQRQANESDNASETASDAVPLSHDDADEEDDEDHPGISVLDLLMDEEARQVAILADDDQLPSPTTSDTGNVYVNDRHRGIRWVLDDPYHVMARIKLPRKHGASTRFAWALRDALFVPDEECLRKVKQVLSNKGKSYQDCMANNSAWLLKRLPRRIPPPDQLYGLVKQVFELYGPMLDAKTKKPLFDATANKIANGILNDIQLGYVSDPPNYELYVKVARDSDGLDIFRCLRGTNSVEGGVHQNLIRIFQSFNASPQYAVNILARYVLHHNLGVISKNTTGRKYGGHYDLALTSDLIDRYRSLLSHQAIY